MSLPPGSSHLGHPEGDVASRSPNFPVPQPSRFAAFIPRPSSNYYPTSSLTYLDVVTLQPLDHQVGEEGRPADEGRSGFDKLCDKLEKLGDKVDKLDNRLSQVGDQLENGFNLMQRSITDTDHNSSEEFTALHHRVTQLEVAIKKVAETQTRLATHNDARHIGQELEDHDISLSLQITALENAITKQHEGGTICRDIEELLDKMHRHRQKMEEDIRTLRLESASRAGTFNTGLRAVQAATTHCLEGLQRTVLSGLEHNRLALDREIKEEARSITSSLSGSYSSLSGEILDLKREIRGKIDTISTTIGVGQGSLESGHRDILAQLEDLPFAVLNVMANQESDDQSTSSSDMSYSTVPNRSSNVPEAALTRTTTDASQSITHSNQTFANQVHPVTGTLQYINQVLNDMDQGHPQDARLANFTPGEATINIECQFDRSVDPLSPSPGHGTSSNTLLGETTRQSARG